MSKADRPRLSALSNSLSRSSKEVVQLPRQQCSRFEAVTSEDVAPAETTTHEDDPFAENAIASLERALLLADLNDTDEAIENMEQATDALLATHPGSFW